MKYAVILRATGEYYGAVDMAESQAAEQMANNPDKLFMPVAVNPLVQVDGLFTLDLDVFRDAFRAQIDDGAGVFRKLFVTDVPGQSQTYEKKETEARRWVSGDEAINPSRYPFMIAEATVRGMTVAAVRAEIMAQVDQLTPVAALIEAHRVAAKQAVLEAATLPEILAAAHVDWPAILP